VLIHVSQPLFFLNRGISVLPISTDSLTVNPYINLSLDFNQKNDCVSRTGRQWPPIFPFFSPCGTRIFSSCDFTFLVGLLPETDSFLSRATALLTLSSTCSSAGLSGEFLVPLALVCLSGAGRSGMSCFASTALLNFFNRPILTLVPIVCSAFVLWAQIPVA
jgi:hypothetical protein